ncbi:MAG: translation initiation factor IF-2 [Lachnospiraceae bacterium]|nr:translation initiation factor IF-2 [Lachnospiraceae bacterium]
MQLTVAKFAKEIEKETAEVLQILKSRGDEIKGSNTISDEQMEYVKSKIKAPAKETNKPEKVEKEAPKASETKAPEAKAPQGETPKKKKSSVIIIKGGSAQKNRVQGARPEAGRNDGQRPVAPQQRQQQPSGNGRGGLIKTNIRTSAMRRTDEDMIVKPQQMQPAPEKKKAPVENEKVEGVKNEQVKSVPEKNVQGNKENTQKSFDNRRNVSNMGGDSRRSDRPQEKTDKQNGKPRVSFGGQGMRQQGGNQGNQNRGGFAGNAQANAMNQAPGSGKDNRRNHDKKNKDKTNQFEDGFRGKQGGKGNKVKMLEKPEQKKQEVKEEEKIKVIVIPEVITIKDLADKMKMPPAQIIKELFLKGQMYTVNQEITYEEAENIALEYEILCEHEIVINPIDALMEKYLIEDKEEDLVERPPVICVMGHVDHGKTSLLDKIRNTHVIAKEAGGITQAIGAYIVKPQGSDKKITFLDTPGHEAFTAMRMRGANATDIAILVVAADDGVMPQTIEAINHAKAAGIEVVVAVNKIDKPSANIDRVKQELAEYELTPEDWGGSTVFAPVSAKTGEGIENLLDLINLTAEIHELKANPNRKATGLVIEAQLDKGRGPVATVLVQKGTLKVGDFIACGECHGKVRAMIDDTGRRVKEAGPSTPVEILGLDAVPGAGEIFVCPETDKDAKAFADTFIAYNKTKKIEETKSHVTLEDMFNQIEAGKLKELNLIIKADVQGSVEAVKESLTKLSNEEVVVKVIHSGVGAINESDVILASASNAIIIGFNVRPDAQAKSTSEHEGVEIKLYDVIYKAIEDVEAAMNGMLDPVFEEKIIGHAEIRQIFKASGVGNIAGSYVLDGVFERGCMVRISRAGEQIFEGNLASLKRFKDDVKEVKSGFECGLVFEDFGAFEEFDIVEAYKMVEVPR